MFLLRRGPQHNVCRCIRAGSLDLMRGSTINFIDLDSFKEKVSSPQTFRGSREFKNSNVARPSLLASASMQQTKFETTSFRPVAPLREKTTSELDLESISNIDSIPSPDPVGGDASRVGLGIF